MQAVLVLLEHAMKRTCRMHASSTDSLRCNSGWRTRHPAARQCHPGRICAGQGTVCRLTQAQRSCTAALGLLSCQ